MPRRSPETLADYLVIAICPTLIALFVGSLMCFLVIVFYPAESQMRTAFVVAMFVMAIVCIARIAMEEGWSYATLYAAPLALVVGYALMRLVPVNPFINWALMGLVWWIANKLTWDCTLIDGWEDVSGQGLLEQIGLEHERTPAASAPGTTAPPGPPAAEATTGSEPRPLEWWQRFLEPDRRPHAPGVWVIYFSLAALPLFGMGGWFVTEPVSKARVFGLLVLFVASGMGLLLSTSFLGLRRYLRQRKLEMPMEMTSTWILVGIGMIFSMLIVAAILPRPSREYSLSQLPFTVSSAAKRASQYAFGKEGVKDDQTKDAASTEDKEQQETKNSSPRKGNSQSQSGQQDGEQASREGQSATKGDQPSSQKGEPQKSKGDTERKQRSGEAESKGKSAPSEAEKQQNGEQSPPEKGGSQDSPPPSQERHSSPRKVFSTITAFASRTLGTLIKLLFYGGLLLGGLVAAWIYREQLQEAWARLMDELRDLWEKWFGKKTATYSGQIGPVEAPPRLFASFTDPFASGQANAMQWPVLVRYTFEALEAWGREHGMPRGVGQTPHEFAALIAATEPGMAANVQTLATLYGQLAYAQRTTKAGSLQPLRELWTSMRADSSNLAAV
jgi:hypothetical protein